MSEPRIPVDFCDWGVTCYKTDHGLYQVLRQRFPVEIADRPRFLFYAHTGHHHRLFNCVRIYFTSEADRPPDWSVCDYALTSAYSSDPRHLRFPPYALIFDAASLLHTPEEVTRIFPQKTRFCAFLSSYRNEKTRRRWDFFEKLCRYKKVDSAGRAGNNIGREIPHGVEPTMEFLRPYKFHLAFENKSVPGYISEKLLLGFSARCIPVYYGDPRVAEEFNPRRFLNYLDFPSEEALIERIKEIDADDALYRQYLAEPIFRNNRPNALFDPEYYLRFFEKVFTSPITPMALRHQQGWRKLLGRWTMAKADKA
jgi:hypothetical protein